MYEFEVGIFIERSPEDIYNYFANPAYAIQWQSGVVSSDWTSPEPHGVGSTWRAVTKFLGRNIEADLEVTEWDPPHKITSKTTSGPIPFEASYTFEASNKGTQVTGRGRGEFSGFFKLAEGLVGKQAEKQSESDLAALKLLLEAG
jgi:hypothetical protein